MAYDPLTETACCPECLKSMSIKHNKRKDGTWKCYHCRKIVAPKRRKKQTLYQQTNKKKPTPNKDIWTEKILLEKLRNYCRDFYWMKQTDMRNVALIAILYLTGARISEIVGLRKYKKEMVGDKIKYVWTGKYIVEPLQVQQVQFTTVYDVPVLEINNLPVLKRYDDMLKANKLEYEVEDHYPRRDVQIPLHHNKEMIDYVKRFMQTATSTKQYLFKFSAQRAWKICKDIIGKHPHFLRHCRISDLIKVYGFNNTQLQHYAGWSSSIMASKYSHIHSSDLLKSMVANWQSRKEELLNSGKTEAQNADQNI